MTAISRLQCSLTTLTSFAAVVVRLRLEEREAAVQPEARVRGARDADVAGGVAGDLPAAPQIRGSRLRLRQVRGHF